MLPKLNGFQVLQTIRQDGLMMPIIVLSARTAEMDKVTGLELGAEDYVAKPFSLRELLARVRAALRRTARSPSRHRPILMFGDVQVDPTARSTSRAGSAVDLTVREFDVLMCLIEARGEAQPGVHLRSRLGAQPPWHSANDRQLHSAVARQTRE